MNHRMIRYIISMFLRAEAAFMVLPIFVCLYYKDFDEILPFVFSIALTLAAALLLGIKKPENDAVFARESFISVALGWILIALFGALPFYISGSIPNIIDCIFETVSGFTTTGATILDTVEHLPKGILFWRAFTHWIGGMGVLVFLLMLTQISEGNAMYIMRAEVPGPSVGKIAPRMRSNSLILYGIYTALTLLEAIILTAEGLTVFDAVTTAMSTAGTGGFSVRDLGIAAYGSPAVDWTVAIFMILFGINFNLYYLLIFGRFRQMLASEELKIYLAIIAAATVTISINVAGLYSSFGEAVRKAFFQVASIITTTGFSNVEFMAWPQLSRAVILMLLFTGACAGSTAGGIKISRIAIMAKAVYRSIHQLAHPHEVSCIKFEGKVVDRETRSFVCTYMTVFFLILFISTFFAMLQGHDFETSFSAMLSCFNNVGPALGLVGHSGNYNIFNGSIKLFMSLVMLIGRLEIFPVLILFMPSTWEKHS